MANKKGKILPAGKNSPKKGKASPVKKFHNDYYFLFKDNSHPMMIFDKENLKFLDVNRATIRKYGYSKKEFLEMDAKDILLKEDLPSLIKFIKEAERNGHKGSKQREEWHHKTKKGKILIVQLTRNIINFQGQKAVIVSIHDITQRKLAEKHLQESEERYRKLMEAANDAIFVADAQTGILIDANKKASQLIGRPISKIIGMHQSELHPESKKNEYRKMFTEGIQREKAVFGDVYAKHKSGKLIPIEISSSIISFGGRKLIQGIFHDISKRKHLDELKTEFLSVASHELKTPITTIKLMFDAMKKKEIVPQSARYFKTIEKELERLTSLISELLDISRIETDKLNLQFEVFDLTALLNNVLEKMQFIAGERKIVFPKKTKVEVMADPERIERVVVNLITNAIKHSPEKSKITVIVATKNKEAVISIKDEGEGIPKADIHKVFDRFYQLKKFGEKTGFGLGLFIAKEIIKEHRGKIWANSKLGKGSTFFFTLPLPKKKKNQLALR